MKRIVAIILCLALLGTLVLSVTAAGSAHMSISASGGTVHRGDSFTLTVNLSNDQPISNGGIVLSYDSSVFELVGGSCSVSNATLAEVSPANGGGVFMLQTDAVVSGTIFTINMKVKSNAAFGTYSVSGTPSLSIDCGISGTSVTVACKHSFGKATKVDGSNHESTCSICGETKKDAHTWDNGIVTKAATCKDTGTKLLKCTACGAEKTETIPVTGNHQYGDWSNLGGAGHRHKCSVCGKEETTDHSWYTYEILEEATCQSTGLKTIVCEDCGASAEQEIPLADHSYDTAANVTATQHTLICTVCGDSVTEDHEFGQELEHDEAFHYYACQICGYKKDQAAHTPGPMATAQTDQICIVCERVLQPRGEHVHQYSQEWSSDDTTHWHICAGCPARDSQMPHAYDNDCDAECNVCHYTRQVTHQKSPLVESDATGHWYPCLICGEKLEFAAHTPGPAATISTPQTCTVCQFELSPVVPHDHIYDSQGTHHYHKCLCGHEYEADAETCGICAASHKQFPWWTICVAEALIFGAVIVYLLLPKKTDSPDAPDEREDGTDETGDSDDDDALLNAFLREEDAPAEETGKSE